LNVTGFYFSDYQINGASGTLPHYEDWVSRELKERIQDRREFTVKTHRGLFHARVGAKVQLRIKNEELIMGEITEFHLRYRKHEAFQSTFKMTEQGNYEAQSE
jgi:hypothetical protein